MGETPGLYFSMTRHLRSLTPTRTQVSRGPLFRNHRGRPWTKDALGHRCRALAKKLGFHICPYAIRHTFATDAIIRGVDVVTISELMGHRNLNCLSRIYQHVKKRSDFLRDALKKATCDEVA